MRLTLQLALAGGLITASIGCTRHDNPQELREKTAQATAEAKRDAKAIAEGVREGWSRDKPVDLNAASKDQLLTLPGISSTQADHIIAERPYSDPHELVTKRIIRQSEYDKVADRLTAK
jgi:DNA uptake protein ComE-like DNA-binding protein